MISAFLQNRLRLRYGLAILAGVLQALSFPKFTISALAWIAPGILLGAAFAAPGRQTFPLGWVAGFAFQLVALYWLLLIPFAVLPIFGWLALCAYLGLYPAAWVWLCWKWFPAKLGGKGESFSIRAAAEAAVNIAFVQRQLWCLWCALSWVALEMLQARLLTGFPWNFLGVSQYRNLPLIQIASITGVYGISFLLAWFSAALFSTGLIVIGRPTKPRLWRTELLAPLVAVIGMTVFGVQAIFHHPAPERTATLALVQPSIPQTLIWNPQENSNRFSQLLQLSEQALAVKPKPDLLIWPEAAVPNLLRYEPEIYEAVTNLAISHSVAMIIGADDALPRPGSTDERTYDYFNSSFLISPRGEIKAVYRKRRLVIFGEYTPLARWIPALARLLPSGEGFRAGDEAVPFEIPDLRAITSVLICFEDTFPHLARQDVLPDTDFLLNLTNNGWFGESAAQWQHAANAVFRAIENGLPLVRCANNGLTCWVDPTGRLHDIYFADGKDPTDIYEAGFKISQVPLLSGGTVRPPTFYNQHGDWFGWTCMLFTVGRLARTSGAGIWTKKFRRRGAHRCA